MTTLSPKDQALIERLEELHKSATCTPWAEQNIQGNLLDIIGGIDGDTYDDGSLRMISTHVCNVVDNDDESANAELIVEFRNSFPRLLAIIREFDTTIERLESIAERHLESMKFMVDRIADLESAFAEKEAAMEKATHNAFVAYFDATSKRDAALSALAIADKALAELESKCRDLMAENKRLKEALELKRKNEAFCILCECIFEGSCGMGWCPMLRNSAAPAKP